MKTITDIEQLLKTGNHFCLAPWVHLHVTSMGQMSLCSMSERGPFDPGYGSLNQQSFPALWQGEAIREFRLKLLRDEADPRCINCYHNRLGQWTLRDEINRYNKHLEWVATTDEHGFAPNAKPLFWDIRFSNICNLKCRSCIDASSSSWHEDSKAMGYFGGRKIGKVIQGLENSDELLNDLKPYLPFVEGLRFAGGEPLLMDENYVLLEHLDLFQKYDTRIEYETNMTALHHKDSNLLSIWSRFTNLLISISLDGLRAQCEYLRKGLKWDEVLQNWRDIQTRCPTARIQINYTVSAYNVLHLPDFHREMVESGWMTADQIQLIFLMEPNFLCMMLLPHEMKKQATRKLKAHVRWLRQQPPFNHSQGFQKYAGCFMQWLACIKKLNEEDWSYHIPNFIDHFKKLDQLRNDESLAIFPELKHLIDFEQDARNYKRLVECH